MSYKRNRTAHHASNPHECKLFVTLCISADEGMCTVGINVINSHGHQRLNHQRSPGADATQVTHKVIKVLVERVHSDFKMIVVVHHNGNSDVLDVIVAPHSLDMSPVYLSCVRSAPRRNHTDIWIVTGADHSYNGVVRPPICYVGVVAVGDVIKSIESIVIDSW